MILKLGSKEALVFSAQAWHKKRALDESTLVRPKLHLSFLTPKRWVFRRRKKTKSYKVEDS